MSDAWMPNIAMWVAPKDEQEFSSDMGTFKKNYVDYDRSSDECISRLRRFNRLLEVTGLEEQTKIPSEAKRQKNEIGNKCVKFSLNHDLSEKEASAAFKSWAADELHSYGFHT